MELKNGEITETTYSDFADRVDRLTIYLRDTHGERRHIALIGENSTVWVAFCLGIYASNNVTVSLDPSKESSDLIEIMKFADVTDLYISEKQASERGDDFATVSDCITLHIMEKTELELSYSDEEIKNRISILRNCPFDNDAVGHIMFTSGTTSVPKGVMLSYSNLASGFRKKSERWKMKEKTVFSIAPYHHVYGLCINTLTFLYEGRTICINNKPENFISNIALYNPEYLTIVPAIAAKLALIIRKQGIEKFRSIAGSNLKSIAIGGASSSSDDVRTFVENGYTVHTGYGATEVGGCCLKLVIEPESIDMDTVFGTLGKYFYTEDTEIKLSETGECLIKGPTVMMGYYKNEKSTSEVLKDGWFNTQDIVRFEDSGYYRYIGRSKNVIILANAENVYPEEIENNFYKHHPEIKQCLVYENCKKINIAVYAPSVSKEQMDEFVAEYNKNVPGYARIAGIVMFEKEMPVTAKGTIRAEEVKKAAAEIASADNKSGEFSGAEESVFNVINSLAEVDGIKRDTNIFDFGVDSLTALEIASSLNINIEDLYRYPTIARLAEITNSSSSADDYTGEECFNEISGQQSETRKRTVFITGTTGFLGSYILHEMSSESSINIICLVRSSKKLRYVYDQYFSIKLPENVRIVKGDITDKFLGLDFNTYASLVNEVDEVIHAAADVHHTGSFDRIYATNVTGTKNIIDFCKNANAVLHHISTYSVSGIGVTKIETTKQEFDENDFWIGQHYKENVYVHTKYEAEKEVLKMRQEGYQANIYRVGSIAWDNDGIFQINEEENGLLCRLKGFMECRTYPGLTKEIYFDITPVDDAAKAICILFFSKNVNMTYHIFNPHFITYQDFADLMNIKAKRTTIEEFNRVKDTSKNVRTLKFYSNLSADSSGIRLSSDKTSKILAQHNFKWKKIAPEYLLKHIES